MVVAWAWQVSMKVVDPQRTWAGGVVRLVAPCPAGKLPSLYRSKAFWISLGTDSALLAAFPLV